MIPNEPSFENILNSANCDRVIEIINIINFENTNLISLDINIQNS